MFEHIYAQKEARRKGILLADETREIPKTFAEARLAVYQKGMIRAADPRRDVDQRMVASYAKLGKDDLQSHYRHLLETGQKTADTREERVRYAGILKSIRDDENAKRIMTDHDRAAAMEKHSLSLLTMNPKSSIAETMLTLAMAYGERTYREQVTEGFATRDGVGNISRAAMMQGRSWIAVRDDLVKFGVLAAQDPRAKVKNADIEWQKGDPKLATETMSSIDVEANAMARLARDPQDEMAFGQLARAGAMQGPNDRNMQQADEKATARAQPRTLQHEL